jgi:predicted O-methyltransferase YrrM
MSDTPNFPNWFDGQRYNFEDQLTHLAHKPDLTFLQIGAYTGDATVWLMQHILTDKTSQLIDVDTWEGSNEDEHSRINFENVYYHYLGRTIHYDNLHIFKATSDQVLPNLTHQFDFIYVDGDHTAAQVERDAENAWKLLKSGGIIAFDDYLWGQDLSPELTPKPAIDRFLLTHTNEYQILVDSYQVWLRKK